MLWVKVNKLFVLCVFSLQTHFRLAAFCSETNCWLDSGKFLRTLGKRDCSYHLKLFHVYLQLHLYPAATGSRCLRCYSLAWNSHCLHMHFLDLERKAALQACAPDLQYYHFSKYSSGHLSANCEALVKNKIEIQISI